MTQNLNEDRSGNVAGSMLWNGRSWHRALTKELKLEWHFFRHANSCRATISFGADENNDGVQLSLCFPWLFSIYVTLCGVRNVKREYEFGVAIHNTAVWLYTGYDPMGGWSRDMPWWDKCHSWYFPWDLEHHKTDVLTHAANIPGLAIPVFTQRRGEGKLGDGSFERTQAAQRTVSDTYDYAYTLKSGEVQHRKATVYVYRRFWRARWWPLIPRTKVRTCINVNFDAEVGEGTGSWKGGCTGCGWELMQGETPRMALKRMEMTRKFDR
jgi:hypothetical protein